MKNRYKAIAAGMCLVGAAFGRDSTNVYACVVPIAPACAESPPPARTTPPTPSPVPEPTPTPTPAPTPVQPRERVSGRCVSSWYQGRKGASGRRLVGDYAAHRTLPFGTKVKVMYGNRSVVVSVLDRGPSARRHPDRCLDLAKGAFAKLASPKKGVINVSYQVL